MTGRATWHWICVPDQDLSFMLDYDPALGGTREDLIDAIHEFQDILEDGLETA